MYFNLAAAGGDYYVSVLRSIVADQITPAQIEEAQELARNWKPKKVKKEQLMLMDSDFRGKWQ